MKTMLDKIGIIGDVKTAFNRLGIYTCRCMRWWKFWNCRKGCYL